MSNKNNGKLIDELVEFGAPTPTFDIYDENATAVNRYINMWHHLLRSKKTVKTTNKKRYDDYNSSDRKR